MERGLHSLDRTAIKVQASSLVSAAHILLPAIPSQDRKLKSDAAQVFLAMSLPFSHFFEGPTQARWLCWHPALRGESPTRLLRCSSSTSLGRRSDYVPSLNATVSISMGGPGLAQTSSLRKSMLIRPNLRFSVIDLQLKEGAWITAISGITWWRSRVATQRPCICRIDVT